MVKRKGLGMVFLSISMALSLVNILSAKITGAVIGISVKSSILTILTFVFFFFGLLFLSTLEKKIIAGIVAGGLAIGGITHKIHSDREKQYLTDIKVTAPYWTDKGRFQRTYRWDEVLDKTEQKYGLPKGILKGLAMQESYGDPLKLNSGKDGGAGLFMFQPRTAKAYGLKVYGNSDRSSADYEHGKELKDLTKKHKNNYEELAKRDERFHIEKSSDAAARYLLDDYKRYKSWDKVISAYNQGKPAPNAEETEHVQSVNHYKEYYNQNDKMHHKYKTPKSNPKGHVSKKGRR